MMPTEFVSIAQANEVWRQVARPETWAKGYNRVAWGYACYPKADDGCFQGRDFRGYEFLPARALNELRVGRVESSGVAIAESITNENLFVNATNLMISSQTSLVLRPLPPTDLARVPNSETNWGRPAAHGDNLVPVLSAGAAFSLLLIAAYVYPFVQQGVITMYTKLVKNQLLDHALRDQLVQLIRHNPGIAAPALRKAANAGWSTIIYHLSVLTENHLITSVRQGRHRRYFLTGALPHGRLAEAALLKDKRTRAVYQHVCAQPGIDRTAIARAEGVTPAAAVWHLDRLTRHGLVRRKKQGRTVEYYPTSTVPPQEVGIEHAPAVAA